MILVRKDFTNFNREMMNVWCASEYLQQQEAVCGIDSKQITQQCGSLMPGQQWSFITQRNKCVSQISSLLVLVFSQDLLTIRNI